MFGVLQLNFGSELQAKAGMLISCTEIVLAFPIVSSVDGAETTDCMEANPQEQFVFAYLPLRMYGFNFIVQGAAVHYIHFEDVFYIYFEGDLDTRLNAN